MLLRGKRAAAHRLQARQEIVERLPLVRQRSLSPKNCSTSIAVAPSDRSALDAGVQREAGRLFPASPEGEPADGLLKILVLPALPAQEPFRSQSVALLKERGVDAIISFRAMLLDLIEKTEVNRSYRKSDTLEMIRILKNYDLLKEPQLDLPAPRATGSKKSAVRNPQSAIP